MFLHSYLGMYVMAVRLRSTAHPTIQNQLAVVGQATHWPLAPSPILATWGMSLLLSVPISPSGKWYSPQTVLGYTEWYNYTN